MNGIEVMQIVYKKYKRLGYRIVKLKIYKK